MKATTVKLFVLVLSVLAWVQPTGSLADQTDPRLNPLFEQLKASQSPAAAQALERLIWEIWLESDQNSINILMRQGVQAMQTGDFATAYDHFSAIVELEPDFAEGWNKRATVLYLMGDLDGSVDDVKRTLALEPRHFGALSGLGLINDALKDAEAALEAYEAALAVHPHLGTAQIRVEQLKKDLDGRKI